MQSSASPQRWGLYFALNMGFLLLLGVGSAVGGSSAAHPCYLMLLFGLCSSPIIDIDRLNGRLALLAMFMLVYFVSYGVVDLLSIFTGGPREIGRQILISKTEAVILAGGVVWIAGYRIAQAIARARPYGPVPKDWRKATTVAVGLILWGAGMYATFLWSVYIVTDTTNEAVRKGITSLSTLAISANILGQMMQPLGVLLLAYALYAFRSAYLLPVVIGIVLLQVALGFVVDIKGMAMYGGILVIVTCVLVTGRLPMIWIAAAIVFVLLVFPIFTAYRTAVHGELGLARTAVIGNFAKVLRLSIAAEDRVNKGRQRAQTFFERASVKGSTQMIVERTGADVRFQYGHTLAPILATFLPRFIWSDKPDVPTGQLVNSEFHVSDNTDVYLSPSHLGELYWNFGWAGVILGMALIGGLCGYTAARCDLAALTTVTRLLILVLTIKQLIISFEGALSTSYVVWLRSLAAVGLLHLLFANVPAIANSALGAKLWGGERKSSPPGSQNAFPNLMT